MPPEPNDSSEVKDESNAVAEEDVLFNQWGDVIELLNISDRPLTGILGDSSAYVRNDFMLIKCSNPVFPQFIRQSNHTNAIKKAIFDVTGRKFRLGIYKSKENNKIENDPLADLINKINEN